MPLGKASTKASRRLWDREKETGTWAQQSSIKMHFTEHNNNKNNMNNNKIKEDNKDNDYNNETQTMENNNQAEGGGSEHTVESNENLTFLPRQWKWGGNQQIWRRLKEDKKEYEPPLTEGEHFRHYQQEKADDIF